jgi:hypothetical protein
MTLGEELVNRLVTLESSKGQITLSALTLSTELPRAAVIRTRACDINVLKNPVSKKRAGALRVVAGTPALLLR